MPLPVSRIACYLRCVAAVILLCIVLAVIDPAQAVNALWPLAVIPNACCCNQEELSSSTSYPGCSCCLDDYDGQFDVEIFGIADDICTDCDSLNGLFTVSFLGGFLDGNVDEQVISSLSGFPPHTPCQVLGGSTLCCRAWGHWFRWKCHGAAVENGIFVGVLIYKEFSDNSSSSSGTVGSDGGDCTIQVFFDGSAHGIGFGTWQWRRRMNTDEINCALIHGLQIPLAVETGFFCNGSASYVVLTAVQDSQSS